MLLFIDEKLLKYDESNMSKEAVESSTSGVNNIDPAVDWTSVVAVLDPISSVLKLSVVRLGEFNVSFIVEERTISDTFKDGLVSMIEDLDGIIFVEVWSVGGSIDDNTDESGKYNDETMVEISSRTESVYCSRWLEK